MVLISKIPTYIKVLIVAIIILIVAYLVKPNFGKKLLNLINKDLIEKNEQSKFRYDSLEKVRQTDYNKFLDALNDKDAEYGAILDELEREKRKTYRYAKELDNYRRSGFNVRYELFASEVKENDLE